MNIIVSIIRVLVGALFIFSGLIKLNDPVGTEIKLEEYFGVFSIEFLTPASLFFSVFLSALEVVLGVALLIRYQMKRLIWALLGMIIFFTFLTFYSAYFNKVTDCGCFGDAIKLTPWESFTKDIILLFMILILFFKRNSFIELLTNKAGFVVFIASCLIPLLIAIYAIRHLPFIDFRPYKIGSNIPELMEVPKLNLKYRYILEKNGKLFEFDNWPEDTTYTYKEMITLNEDGKILSPAELDKMSQPKITDYSVKNDEGDFTEATFEGTKLLILINDVIKTNKKSIENINALIESLKDMDIKPMVLTSTNEPVYDVFRHEVQLAVPYYFTDATVLKTMIRSNPGIILIQEGTVIGKWHFNDVPDAEVIESLYN